MAVLMMLALMPVTLTAATETSNAIPSVSVTVATADANALIARLDVIKAMDLSTLTSVQKRELRREVRSINGTLKEMGGEYIYVSAGGILLIVLLLIILL